MNYGQFGGQYVPQQLKDKLNFINKKFNELKKDDIIVVCLSGRGDKDIDNVLEYDGGLL